jgi:uncharacterized phiE125 gp8 family phage protein
MAIVYSKVTSAPTVEPLSLTEAKLDLKIDSTDENDLIEILIKAARETVEIRTGRSLITQSRAIKMDYFPCTDTIRIPNGPVQAITHIKYYDDDEVLQTLSASDYWVDADSDIARVVVKDSWPSTEDRPNAVIITYTCGYGAAGSNVPAPLRKAMLFILGHLYENRQNVIVSGSSTGVLEIPMGAEYLMSNYILEQEVYY